MDLNSQLQKFTQGGLPYSDQVALFAALFPDARALLKQFRNEDAWSRKKLRQELEKAVTFEKNKKENSYGTFAPPAAKIDLEKLPADLRTEYMKQSARIREAAALKGRLYQCATNAERLNIAIKLVQLWQERRATFTRVDHYLATGEQLLSKPPAQTRILPGVPKNYDVEYQLKLLRTRRSKLKNVPARAKEFNDVCLKIQELERSRYA